MNPSELVARAFPGCRASEIETFLAECVGPVDPQMARDRILDLAHRSGGILTIATTLAMEEDWDGRRKALQPDNG